MIEDLIRHSPLVTTELPHNEVEHRVAQFRQSSLHVWGCVCVSVCVCVCGVCVCGCGCG